MKKGPLSKEEKALIAKNVKTNGLTVTALAEKMNRSVHMVEKFIAKLDFLKKKFEDEQTEEPEAESSAPADEPNPLYARNVAENGVVRSTIGTQAASMAADESRAKRKESSPVAPRYSKHIHQIKSKGK